MRKIFVTAILAFIGLGSLVVLGSSPEFLDNLLASVQNNPITGVFSTDTEKELALRNAEPVSAHLLTTATPPPPEYPIPDEVLYDKLFRIVLSLKKQSESSKTHDQRSMGPANYFKERANLTDQENQLLQDTAIEFLQEVSSLDAQARSIVHNARQNSVNSVVSRDQSPPAELVALQKQKDELVLHYRDHLKESLDGDGFGKIDKFIHGGFASHFRVMPLSSVDFAQSQGTEVQK